jgi:hypothetical protein
MAKLELLQGVVSHVSRGTSVHGNIQTSAVTGNTSGSISSGSTYSFRVDGRPVEFALKDVVCIAEGDNVRVAGLVKKGHLTCYAFKNLDTQAEHDCYSTWTTVYAWLILLFGVLTLFILLGIFIVIGGIMMLVIQRRVKKCIQLVAEGGGMAGTIG